jgi:hypothetical protein
MKRNCIYLHAPPLLYSARPEPHRHSATDVKPLHRRRFLLFLCSVWPAPHRLALSSAPPSPPTSCGDARLPSPPSVDGATPPLHLRPALARPLCLRSAGGDDSTTERARRGGVVLLRRAGLSTLLSLPSRPPFSSSEDRISRRCVLSPGRQFPLPICLLCLGTCLESTVAN